MSGDKCEKHGELFREAESILEQIRETILQQKSALEYGVGEPFLNMDRSLELLMGEKERAIGALRQHDEEHGCQIPKASS